MPRTVPSVALQNPGNIVTSALWNNGPKAMCDFYVSPPLFRGRQATTQVIATGTWTVINLDAEDVDTENGHSNTVNNSRYVCQVAGWYWVTGFVAWPNSNNQADIYCALYVNGSAHVYGSPQALLKNANGFSSVSASGLVYLQVNDYVQVHARQDTGANYTTFDSGVDLCPCMNLVWVHS